MRNQKAAACAEYLKNQPAFTRLMEGFLNNYRRIGRVAGSVFLSYLSPEEKRIFQEFFLKDFSMQTNASISSGRFERALRSNDFDGFDLTELLQEYYGGLPETRDEERARKAKKSDTFWKDTIEEYEGTFTGSWLSYVMESKENAYAFLLKKYSENKEDFKTILFRTMTAANKLPVLAGLKETLSEFAARTLNDPGFFNDGTIANRMLSYIIRYYLLQQKNRSEVAERYDVETRNELFYTAGLVREDQLSATLAYGVRCIRADGSYHKGVEGYFTEKQPVHMSLLTLGDITAVETEADRVYVVESSDIFLELIRNDPGRLSCVCINGKLDVASLYLLELLCTKGCKLYYAGGLEPEGLQLAQRLKHRYGDDLVLWRMDENDYEQALTNETFSPRRLERLYYVKDEELVETGNAMQSIKRQGDRRLILKSMSEDVRRYLEDGEA